LLNEIKIKSNVQTAVSNDWHEGGLKKEHAVIGSILSLGQSYLIQQPYRSMISMGYMH
jgi:hypothetical protein